MREKGEGDVGSWNKRSGDGVRGNGGWSGTEKKEAVKKYEMVKKEATAPMFIDRNNRVI